MRDRPRPESPRPDDCTAPGLREIPRALPLPRECGSLARWNEDSPDSRFGPEAGLSLCVGKERSSTWRSLFAPCDTPFQEIGEGTMSLAYRILYAVGFTPWEQMAHPQIVGQYADLFAREEEGREPPYGRALDLGCGSGIWAVALAQRGWQVTGVDFVPKALRRARERAEQADVEVEFLEGRRDEARRRRRRLGVPAPPRLPHLSRRAVGRAAKRRGPRSYRGCRPRRHAAAVELEAGTPSTASAWCEP